MFLKPSFSSFLGPDDTESYFLFITQEKEQYSCYFCHNLGSLILDDNI